MGPSATVCSVCGEPLEAQRPCFACLLRAGLDENGEPGVPEAAAVFDDFEIARQEDGALWELGRGAMGVTYRATEKTLHRSVALKVIESHGSEEVRERFLREARAAAALRHPNVATVFRFGALSDSDRCYCAMELVEGETLEALVRRDGPLKLETALEIAIQVTRALIAAADRNLVHRDLKPGNIMLARGDHSNIEVKVIDFGLAKAASHVPGEMDLTHGEFVGTPAFASPEQFAGGSVDARTDIYALGVTLWFALTARLPFAGRTIEEIRQHEAREKLPLEQLRGVPRCVIELLQSCLAIDPTERPASARRLLEALDSCRAESGSRRRSGKLAALTAIAVLAVGIAGLMLWRNREHDRAAPTAIPEKSIAVLPFENRSRDPDNAYFADGIQDEILTRLSKIADLKVISRTSTQHYKSAPENLPEIARQLGVAYVLEGSVQKEGDAVRVNVQLIKAANDSHFWADIFDRKMTGILSVESEVAKAIADQLRAKLTGQEEQVLAAQATRDPQAYDAYLRGLAYSLKPANTTANVLGAQKYLKEAVRLDPKFALAWALLCSVDSIGYRTAIIQPTEALREEARQAGDTAVSLQPKLGEAVLAKGYYYYGCLKDYDTAIRYFEQARQLLPNDSRIPESLAYVTRRRGQWEKSESYFNEAERLDVRNVNLLTQHALSYMRRRRFPEALRKLDQVLNITPDDLHTVVYKASIAQAEGDLPRAASLLAPLHPDADDAGALETQVYQAILERRPQSIIPRLKEILDKPDPALGYLNGDLRVWLGWAQEIAGDRAAAQASWQQARSELDSLLKDQPENVNLLGDLALANACLGNKAAALALAERALAANPLEQDAVSGPSPIEVLARVAARTGEHDRALTALQKLLSIPALTDTAAPFTAALVRLDPTFDSLRSDPRFEKILVEAEEMVARQSLATNVPEKSIAVLPFENLSEEKANEYFAAGIQDEILTSLAAVRDLKVISRTSTAKYKSKPENLKKVAEELGVAAILEGSVQKNGDTVRINVQLIGAATDSHLWAETYDRKLTDIFSVESEVAKAIAARLQAKLTGEEEQSIAAKPTDNTEAYDAYLRGLAFSLKTANTTANHLNAQKHLKEAVRLDPKFALAWALLSYVDAVGYRTQFLQPTAALREEARQAAETALTLQPKLGEAVLAKGFYLYACLSDYNAAFRYFEQARPLLPNSSRIPESLAYVTRKKGRWDRSEAYFNEAERLDPRNVSLLTQHALSYKDRRQFPEALRKFEEILNITPDDADTIVEKAVIAQAEGQLPQAAALLAPLQLEGSDPNALETQAYQVVLERRPGPIIARIEGILAAPDPDLGFTNGELRFWLGWTKQVSGDQAGARETWQQARAELESFLAEHPQEYILLGDLALTYAALGDKAAAIRLAEQGMAAFPIEKDAVSGPKPVEYFARVTALVGENDRAIAAIQKLLATSYSGALGPGAPLTPALLRLDPMFDRLRDDPRFQELCGR
jgi:TolB-like protein/Tfp pilus assembly protein PilF/predicted Ser/Thr protein kinase